MQVRVFAFEDIDEGLPLLPLAARRALDHAGRRLSLAAWRTLDLPARVKLVQLGGAQQVPVEQVCDVIASAVPPASACPVRDGSELSERPTAVKALGVSAAQWRRLGPLERFVVAHLAKRQRAALLRRALGEMGQGDGTVGHDGGGDVGGAPGDGQRGPLDGPNGEVAQARGRRLTHLSASGDAHMVDVADKPITKRQAVAAARVVMRPATARLVEELSGPKGDVLAVARVAGIMAAKRTPELIPLCHHIALTRVTVSFRVEQAAGVIQVSARAEARDRTGVEMEAMVAASVAALTIYDMLKAVEKGIVVEQVVLLSKDGGRSGHYQHHDPCEEDSA